ncbi:MAG: hypothetical protein PHS92_00180 [Candidatus Gracilibacteria bacterium]|nr:hypothetical protein [Candidatus Gracilibacteria bacterium]
MTSKNQDIIMVPDYETGITEEYKVGSFNKEESRREAQKIYELLLEKERVLTQLDLLKEKISLIREKTKILPEDEKEVENIYGTINHSDDANFELALYCFENNKPIKGIEYLKKSLNISSKHKSFVIDYINNSILLDVKNGLNYKENEIFVLFVKTFKTEVLDGLNQEIKTVSGTEKNELNEFLEYLKNL